MSVLIHAAIDDLTLAVRNAIHLAVRAAAWVLLPDEDEDEES